MGAGVQVYCSLPPYPHVFTHTQGEVLLIILMVLKPQIPFRALTQVWMGSYCTHVGLVRRINEAHCKSTHMCGRSPPLYRLLHT